jgi:hypothetical protein
MCPDYVQQVIKKKQIKGNIELHHVWYLASHAKECPSPYFEAYAKLL